MAAEMDRLTDVVPVGFFRKNPRRQCGKRFLLFSLFGN